MLWLATLVALTNHKNTMKMKPISFSTRWAVAALSLAATVAYADSTTAPSPKQDAVPPTRQSEELPEVAKPNIEAAPAKVLPTEQHQANAVEASPEYLRAHPQVLEQFFVRFLQSGNAELLQELIPIYQQVENRDDSLIDWANAVIAMNQGAFPSAIKQYRHLVGIFPNVAPIRFQLGLALFFNRELVAAKSELSKVRSQVSGPILAVVDRYLERIEKQNSWQFDGALSLLHDNNLNNVPPKGTKTELSNGFTAEVKNSPESGSGFNVGLSGLWRKSLLHGFYATLNTGVNAAVYLNNPKYNRTNFRLGVGLGYANAYTDVSVSPFFRRGWYARGSLANADASLYPYSVSVGGRLSWGQWLSPKWRNQLTAELGYDDFVARYAYNTGRYVFLSDTVSYVRSASQYFYFGVDYMDKNARSQSSGYNRFSTRLGWGQDWWKGFATLLNVSYGRRVYDGVNFNNLLQKNNEYGVDLSIWNKNVYLFGITPRLVLSYAKTNSNDPLSSYSNANVNVDFSRSF